MPRIPPVSDEDVRAACEAFEKAGRNAAEASRVLNVSRSTIQNRVTIGARRGLLGTDPVIPGFAIKKLSRQIGPEGETQREWIEQGPEPGEEFQLPEGHTIKGVSALVDADGRTVQQWIKTKADDDVPALIDAIKTAFNAYEGRAELTPAPAKCDAMLMSVYPIADQHLGLMAWGRETGESYDLKIGANRLRSSFERLIAQSPHSESALILNLGDFFHADDGRNVTPTSGFKLDVDGRYFKVLTTGVQLMLDCIDRALQKHNRVVVVNLPGNHDPHASIALTVALSAFYSKEPRVTISEDPSEFFYHKFGNVLIGANHGHRVKPVDLAQHMAATRAAEWGATKYRHYLTGHLHHVVAKEVMGVVVETFQTLAAKDAYHASHGYLAGQSITSITFHHQEGEIGRHRINISPPEHL